MLKARYLCVLILITSMLLVQSFGTTGLGVLTSIPNYLMQSSWAQSGNAPPSAPSRPVPIPPPSPELPLSPPTIGQQGDTGNGDEDGGNGTRVLGDGYSEYTNDEYGISLKYPSNYYYSLGDFNSSDSIIELIYFAIPNSDSKVAMWAGPENTFTPSEAGEVAIFYWKQEGFSPTVLNASGTMGGHPAYQFLAKKSPDSWIHSTLTVTGNTLYEVDYRTSESSYEANLPVVQDFIKSIEIKPR